MQIINEELARTAWSMNHMSDYEEGSATRQYEAHVARAEYFAAERKKACAPIYHDKLDRLVEAYKKKIAETINYSNKVDAMCPSILISGAGNFPTAKKAKQNARRGAVKEMYDKCDALLDKIKSTGTGGISADDPDAVEKIKLKIDAVRKEHETMKAKNAAARAEKKPAPYASFQLSYALREIKRLEGRIKEIENRAGFSGWSFPGGVVEVDESDNRVRIRHDEKPEQKVIDALKANGFRWSPRNGAWQRQLTRVAMLAAKQIVGGEAR